MSVPPTFTIVIPAYNRERFIATAIASALSQTRPADEIIVVDDGSTDRTREIAETYVPRVCVIPIENNGAGPSRPRNVGIAAARFEFITLLDSDDRLHPTVLERHAAILSRFPHLGLICNNFRHARWDNGELTDVVVNEATMVRRMEKQQVGVNTYLIRSQVAFSAYCSGNFIKTPGTTVPKRAWQQVGGFDETLRTCNDYDFFIRVLAHHDMCYVDEILETIIRHEGNISTVNVRRGAYPEYARNHLRVLRRELEQAGDRNVIEALCESIRRHTLSLAYTSRRAGEYRGAVRAFVEYVRAGGSCFTALRGMAKIPPCALLGWRRSKGREQGVK